MREGSLVAVDYALQDLLVVEEVARHGRRRTGEDADGAAVVPHVVEDDTERIENPPDQVQKVAVSP